MLFALPSIAFQEMSDMLLVCRDATNQSQKIPLLLETEALVGCVTTS